MIAVDAEVQTFLQRGAVARLSVPAGDEGKARPILTEKSPMPHCRLYPSFLRLLRGDVLGLLFFGICMTATPGLPASIQAQAATDASSVRFRAQGLPNALDVGVTAQAQRAVLRAFLEDHPGYEIEPFIMPTVEGGAGIDTGPLMAIAAGIPPHVISVNFRQSSTYMSQGFLEPLEILLARVLSADERVRQCDDDDRWLADPATDEIERALALIQERTPAPAWPVVYREDESGHFPGRHAWAVPDDALVIALLYRKDLFREAGLDPERPPRDWEQFLDDARALTVPARQQSGFMLHGGPHLSWEVYTFMVSNGANAVAFDETQQSWSAAYGSVEAAEAVHFVWRLVNEPFERDGRTIRGAVRIGTSELDVMWDQGRIAMRFDYLSDQVIERANPQLIGIAPVPLSPKGTRGSEFNSRMLGVFSGSTPRQKLAAMRYLWFRTSDEARRISTRIYVDQGYGQFANPHYLAKFGHDRVLQRVPEDWKLVFSTAMAAGVPEPYGRNTQNIYLYLSKPIETVLRWSDLDKLPRDRAIDRIQRELAASAQDTNVKLLGNVSPEQMRQRRVVASLVIVVIFTTFIWGAAAIWRYFGKVAVRSTEGGARRRYLLGYALLIPALLITIGWTYVPLAWGFTLAFTDYRLVIDSAFVGVDNFAAALYDANFWRSLVRTFYFVALVIGLGFWPPILLAILLDEVPTVFLKYLYRIVFYLPAIISGVIIMFLWKQLYDPSEHGALNHLLLSLDRLPAVAATLLKWVMAMLWLSFVATPLWLAARMHEMSVALRAALAAFGVALLGVTCYAWFAGEWSAASLVGRFELRPLDWVASPRLAMLCVVLPIVWAGAGPGCLLYLAALKTIPTDLYEAADLDGAGTWHKVCYITLPRLKYLIGIQFIAAVIGAFKGGADYILAITGGGPGDATLILSLHIFIRTFMELQFGVGAAMAWLLGALLVGFTAYQLKMLSKAEFRAAGAT